MKRKLAQAAVERGGWYDGPWIKEEDITSAERRWAKRSYTHQVLTEPNWSQWQCGACKYFAALGTDYGLCWNEKSPLDGCVTFEHGGCGEHSGYQKHREKSSTKLQARARTGSRNQQKTSLGRPQISKKRASDS